MREEQARKKLAGMDDSLNDKTQAPPPSSGLRKTAADRQQEHKEAKEADEHARLAAEVEQLNSQLDKEKKKRLSQSVADATPKRAKPSAAAQRLLLGKSW